MQAIPQVRTSTVRPILDFLEQTGVEPGPLLTSARALLHDPTALIPVVTAGALFEEAERVSQREDFGFRAGMATSILELGDWGVVIAGAVNVAGLIAAMITTARRFNTGQRFWAVQRGDSIWLHQLFSSRVVRGRRQACEFALMMILQAIRLAAGRDWRPRELHLEGPPPGHAGELATLAEKRIFFEQPYTALVFPVRVLACRFPRLPSSARPVALARIPSSRFEDSIRQVVASLLRLGVTELTVAAEAAHMSERSLQRRLTECGLNFSRLVEEARFESACRLLSDPSVKIVEISAELGYTDSANFTRAFRRWSGVSPQAYRRSA